MDVRRIPISQINPAPYNPRKQLKPSDPVYKKIARSLKEFSLVEPLIWNAQTGHLVGGHQRLQVLMDQGETEVEVSIVNLPLAKEQKLNLALNNLKGEWDQAKLVDLIAELSQEDMDLSVTGFDEPDIQKLLEFHPGQHSGDFLNQILIEPPPTVRPQTARLPAFVAQTQASAPLAADAPSGVGVLSAPAGEARVEYFQMAFAFTYEQRQLVQTALQRAKKVWGLDSSLEALVAICEQYLEGVSHDVPSSAENAGDA
jgi:hypothetical protein